MILDELERVREAMNIGAATGDGWHDEAFKIGIGDEQRLMSQLSVCDRQLGQCQVIVPVEQNEVVKIGSVVTVEYLKDHLTMTFVFDGIPSYDGVCSSGSPLGQLLDGRRKGDIVEMVSAGTSVKIIEIFPPSYYEVFKKQNKSSQ